MPLLHEDLLATNSNKIVMKSVALSLSFVSLPSSHSPLGSDKCRLMHLFNNNNCKSFYFAAADATWDWASRPLRHQGSLPLSFSVSRSLSRVCGVCGLQILCLILILIWISQVWNLFQLFATSSTSCQLHEAQLASTFLIAQWKFVKVLPPSPPLTYTAYIVGKVMRRNFKRLSNN